MVILTDPVHRTPIRPGHGVAAGLYDFVQRHSLRRVTSVASGISSDSASTNWAEVAVPITPALDWDSILLVEILAVYSASGGTAGAGEIKFGFNGQYYNNTITFIATNPTSPEGGSVTAFLHQIKHDGSLRSRGALFYGKYVDATHSNSMATPGVLPNIADAKITEFNLAVRNTASSRRIMTAQGVVYRVGGAPTVVEIP